MFNIYNKKTRKTIVSVVAIILAISISSGAITCSLASTKVSFKPNSWRFSNISSPINPPPTTVTCFGLFSSINDNRYQ